MNVLVLTGAGISAESGVPTFRDADGLWEGHRFEDVATPEAFEADPALVHEFYNQRRRAAQDSKIVPNLAHLAIAEFEASHTGGFLLVTQNIDPLHQRAGSQNVLPMHGELLKVRCTVSGEIMDWTGDLTCETEHPKVPGRIGSLRPHVVWFGEMPIGLDRIAEAAAAADVFVAIGTSSLVYPAAGIVDQVRPDCRTVEINLERTPRSGRFCESIQGKATRCVPEFFARLKQG